MITGPMTPEGMIPTISGNIDKGRVAEKLYRPEQLHIRRQPEEKEDVEAKAYERPPVVEPVHDKDSEKLANQLREASEADRSPSPYVTPEPAETPSPARSTTTVVDAERGDSTSDSSDYKPATDTPEELEHSVGGEE